MFVICYCPAPWKWLRKLARPQNTQARRTKLLFWGRQHSLSWTGCEPRKWGLSCNESSFCLVSLGMYLSHRDSGNTPIVMVTVCLNRPYETGELLEAVNSRCECSWVVYQRSSTLWSSGYWHSETHCPENLDTCKRQALQGSIVIQLVRGKWCCVGHLRKVDEHWNAVLCSLVT
jgi:hypothetical protein